MKNTIKLALALGLLFSFAEAQFLAQPAAYPRVRADTLSDTALAIVQIPSYGGSATAKIRSITMTQLANKVSNTGGDASFDSLYANKGVFGTLSATTVYFNDTTINVTDSVLRIINAGHNAFFDSLGVNNFEVFGSGPSPLRVTQDSGIATGKWSFSGKVAVASANKLTVAGDTVATLNNIRSFVQSGDNDAAFHDVTVSNSLSTQSLVIDSLLSKACIGTDEFGNVIEGSCGGGLDSVAVASIVSDSLDSAIRSGNGDIDVNNARIRGTGDVDGQFRAGSLTGPDYALKVVPGDHEISTDQTIFVKIDGGMEIGKNGVGDYGVYIDTTTIQTLPGILVDVLGSMNVHRILSVGDVGDGTNPLKIDVTSGGDLFGLWGGGDADLSDTGNFGYVSVNGGTGYGQGTVRLFAQQKSGPGWTMPEIQIQPANDDETIGAVNLNGAITTVNSTAFEVAESTTPDFYGGLNVHGVLAVGPVDGGGSSIYIGGDNTAGDSLTGSFVWATNLAAGTLNISAVQHQGGETTTNTIIALTPYAENAAIGTVRLDGEAVNVSSFSTGSTKFVCASSSGDLFTSATVCVGP